MMKIERHIVRLLSAHNRRCKYIYYCTGGDGNDGGGDDDDVSCHYFYYTCYLYCVYSNFCGPCLLRWQRHVAQGKGFMDCRCPAALAV